MAVSKRLRYEVLRRDNHQCRYCGGTAPDVKLTVDHVVPVALGGGDEPENLVAACRDCNAGKTSSNPDAPLVATVADDALRWAKAMEQASAELATQERGRSDAYAAVDVEWHRGNRPQDWTESIDNFLDAGLPKDVIARMARVAQEKTGEMGYRWAYFCGCCWTRIRQMQDRAATLVKEETAAEGRLETSWTDSELGGVVGFHEAKALDHFDAESVSRISCRHRAEGDCGDPLCQMERAGDLQLAYSRLADETFRERQVMDELDRLESEVGF